jgi:hypothetical protein
MTKKELSPEEVLAQFEANELMLSCADSCRQSSPYYLAHAKISATKGSMLALMNLSANEKTSRLDVAQSSFRLGVYLGLLYKRFEEM